MMTKQLGTMRCFIIMISALLISCSSSDDEELSRYIYRIETRPAKPIEPMPTIVYLQKFIFPENDIRRSPFIPVKEPQSDQFAPNIKRPKQPLEAFPLDALKFVGTFKDGDTIWALIGQPGGFISRITLGQYMGQNYGQVVKIDQKTMEVEETVQLNGKWGKKITKISLFAPPKKS